MLLEELKQINRIYHQINDIITDILENTITENDSCGKSFSFYDLAIYNDNNYQDTFNSAVIDRKNCLLLYNLLTNKYRLENLDFITNYTKNNDNVIHITKKHEFKEFWYNLITGNFDIANKEVFIDDSIINDIIMSLFSEIEYFEKYLENYTPIDLQINNKSIYIYVDAFNCDKIKNVKLSPRITLNIYTGFIMNNDLIASIGHIIKAYLEKLNLNYFKICFYRKHKTFIKTSRDHHIYFDIIFETDKLIDLINMYVLAEKQKFSYVK